jgi:hypothetical protein
MACLIVDPAAALLFAEAIIHSAVGAIIHVTEGVGEARTRKVAPRAERLGKKVTQNPNSTHQGRTVPRTVIVGQTNSAPGVDAS